MLSWWTGLLRYKVVLCDVCAGPAGLAAHLSKYLCHTIMVHGKWIAFISRFLSKSLYSCLTFTHSYTDGGANHAR